MEWKQLNSWDNLEEGMKIRIRWVADLTKYPAAHSQFSPNPGKRATHQEWKDAVCVIAGKGHCRARLDSGSIMDLTSVRQFQVYK